MDTQSIWLCGMTWLILALNRHKSLTCSTGRRNAVAVFVKSDEHGKSGFDRSLTMYWKCKLEVMPSKWMQCKGIPKGHSTFKNWRYQRLPKIEGYHDLKGRQCNIAVSSCQSDFSCRGAKAAARRGACWPSWHGQKIGEAPLCNRSFVLPIDNKSSFSNALVQVIPLLTFVDQILHKFLGWMSRWLQYDLMHGRSRDTSWRSRCASVNGEL